MDDATLISHISLVRRLALYANAWGRATSDGAQMALWAAAFCAALPMALLWGAIPSWDLWGDLGLSFRNVVPNFCLSATLWVPLRLLTREAWDPTLRLRPRAYFLAHVASYSFVAACLLIQAPPTSLQEAQMAARMGGLDPSPSTQQEGGVFAPGSNWRALMLPQFGAFSCSFLLAALMRQRKAKKIATALGLPRRPSPLSLARSWWTSRVASWDQAALSDPQTRAALERDVLTKSCSAGKSVPGPAPRL